MKTDVDIKEVKISNYLWDFIKTNENLVFLKWPEQRQQEFAEIKKLNSDRRIILSKIREYGIWDVDISKIVNPYKFYRFKSDIQPIYTNEYILPIVSKTSYIIAKDQYKEIVRELLKYIKTSKEGFSYSDLSKFIVEKFFKEEYAPSYNQAHSSMFSRFIKPLNKLNVSKVGEKYVYTSNNFSESIKDFNMLDKYKLFTKIVRENDIFDKMEVDDTSILQQDDNKCNNCDIQKTSNEEPYRSGILNFENPEIKKVYTSLILNFKPSEIIID